MKSAFSPGGWLKTRKQDRLINRLIIESERPKPRLGLDPLQFGQAGFRPERRVLAWWR